MDNELISKLEAQKILKVGNNVMFELLKNEKFSLKIGVKWYVNKKKLLLWIDEQTLK